MYNNIYKGPEEVAWSRAREIARWKKDMRRDMLRALLTPICAVCAGAFLFLIAYIFTP